MKKPDFLEKNIIWIVFMIPFVIGVIKLFAMGQSDWMTTGVYLIYIAGIIPASIGIWLVSYGTSYGINHFANNIPTQSDRIKRKTLGVYLALIISILLSIPSGTNKDAISNEVTTVKVSEKMDQTSKSAINKKDNQIIEDKKQNIKKYFADPNSTMHVMGLMMNEAKGLNELQDLILTEECLSFSKLYTSQAKKLNMGDGTTITRIQPINLYDVHSYQKNGPLFDEVSTESAGNCVKTLIKGGLINLEATGDEKLIETLKYMEL